MKERKEQMKKLDISIKKERQTSVEQVCDKIVHVIVLQHLGYFTAYVGVKTNRFLTDVALEDVEVHGGITYNQLQIGDGYPTNNAKYDGWQFIGFDCNHLGDKPSSELVEEFYDEELADRVRKLEALSIYEDTTFKDANFVKAELVNLAKQVKKVAEGGEYAS
jgi:hypothetical protein